MVSGVVFVGYAILLIISKATGRGPEQLLHAWIVSVFTSSLLPFGSLV